MILLDKKLESEFAKMGRQENDSPVVIAKFFNPTGSGTWFATEYDAENKIFFGYVSIFNDENNEWGDFSLDELQSYKGRFGLGIERDLHFTPAPMSEVKRKYGIV